MQMSASTNPPNQQMASPPNQQMGSSPSRPNQRQLEKHRNKQMRGNPLPCCAFMSVKVRLHYCLVYLCTVCTTTICSNPLAMVLKFIGRQIEFVNVMSIHDV